MAICPSHVVSEEVDGEAVILNLRTGNYYALNRSGTRMWQLLRDGSTTDQVCERVASEFGVDRSTVEADVHHLVGELTRRGLLQGGDGAG